MFTLTVMVLVATLQRPVAHPVLTARIPYPTRYTCEEALDRLDGDAFIAITKKPKGTRKTAVSAECVPSNDIS